MVRTIPNVHLLWRSDYMLWRHHRAMPSLDFPDVIRAGIAGIMMELDFVWQVLVDENAK